MRETADGATEKKTSRRYRVILWLIRLFSPSYTLAGEENLPDRPCVIVGNHCQIYGPIAGELYMPMRHDIWCVWQMMDRREVPAYAFQDFWSRKPASTHWFYKMLSHLIAPLAELIFTSAHTIPVYHDARLLKTIRMSLDSLQAGRTLVIFPECYEKHNNIVNGFQDKFVDLARFYHKKTGEELSFVPMYIAPRLKMIFFGEPIRFRADAPVDEERKRIRNGLMDAITGIAVAQPEHTVIPYANVSKKQYPKNIPLVVYTDEKAAD